MIMDVSLPPDDSSSWCATCSSCCAPCAGLEQRQSAQTAGVNALPFLVEENAAEGCFGAALYQHVPFVLAEIGNQASQLAFAGRC